MSSQVQAMDAPTPAGDAAIAAAQALMDRRARVRLSDGRVLLGRLTCLDWQGNLLLSDAAVEASSSSSSSGGGGGGSSGDGDGAGAEAEARGFIGVAIVPARYLVACEVLAEDAASASLPP